MAEKKTAQESESKMKDRRSTVISSVETIMGPQTFNPHLESNSGLKVRYHKYKGVPFLYSTSFYTSSKSLYAFLKKLELCLIVINHISRITVKLLHKLENFITNVPNKGRMQNKFSKKCYL